MLQRVLPFILSAACLVLAGCRNDLTLFAPSEASFPVILPRESSELERQTAEDLARVLRVMSGRPVEVRSESPWRLWEKGIHLGATRRAKRLAPLSSLLPRGSFVICTRGRSLFLRGTDPESTAHAAYAFLRVHGGVRWFVPGELGEDIPRRERCISWKIRLTGVVSG